MKKPVISIQSMVLCALFAALIAVCAWISIPIGAVPITLQLLAILVCAALLKPLPATLTMVVYLLLGAVGVPVFSGFRGGIGVLLGPTGGYIIGFIFTTLIVSLLVQKFGRSMWKLALIMTLGVVICYVFGTGWFMLFDAKGRALPAVLAICVTPFIPFDLAKIAISAILANRLYKPMQRIVNR